MKRKFVISTALIVVVSLIISTFFVTLNYIEKKNEEKRIESARVAVNEAKNSKDSLDIEEAKELIEIVETSEIKEELNSLIISLEIDIEKDKITSEYKELLDGVEANLNQEELNKVISNIEKIEYEDIRNSLLERCSSIKEKIDEKAYEEKKRLEQLSYYNRMKAVDATKIVSTPPSDVSVLETLSGKITAFTPYCNDGCSGYTASGKFVGNGDIYYYDKEFGTVRIVAGDSSYPFGTIVRLKSVGYFGSDVYAIVLDRGGAIGKGRRALFDLLFASEENANNFGVTYVDCEILRLGY